MHCVHHAVYTPLADDMHSAGIWSAIVMTVLEAGNTSRSSIVRFRWMTREWGTRYTRLPAGCTARRCGLWRPGPSSLIKARSSDGAEQTGTRIVPCGVPLVQSPSRETDVRYMSTSSMDVERVLSSRSCCSKIRKLHKHAGLLLKSENIFEASYRY